ncbi:MAG: hypothetical protein WAP74_00055 [Patescibacteria group bacterium]
MKVLVNIPHFGQRKTHSKKTTSFAEHAARGMWKHRRIKDAAAYALKLRREAWAQ